MPQQDPSFGHKLSPVAHQANPFKFSVNGIAQLARVFLLQKYNLYLFQAWLIFEQNGRQCAHEFMSRSGHALQDFATNLSGGCVKSGMNVKFSGDILITKEVQIRNWAKEAVKDIF